MSRQPVSPIQEPFGFAGQTQASDYYPFGMALTMEFAAKAAGKALTVIGEVVDKGETDDSKTFTRSNAYLYNGKEEQPMPGKWLDYGARFYDAQLGRWHSVDPLAEAFANQTPYNFTLNNPINSIDPNGLYTLTVNGRELKGSEKQRYQDSHGLPDDGPDEDEKRPEPTFSGYLSFILEGIKDAFTFDVDTKNQKTQENLERKSENIANAIILIETTSGIISVLVPFSSVAEIAAKIEAGHGLAALAAVPFVVLDAVPAGKGSLIIKSVVKTDSRLFKLAIKTFDGNELLRKEANSLIEQLSKGNFNPGIGTKFIQGTKDVFEARSRNGARVYFRNAGNGGVEIVGYSNKPTQTAVISRLIELYE